ncbi:MAG: HAMP domain-containing sensor histidine kinase [Bacteroidales bacterium]|nr:HAMP domain-containing sensor histidine kinase [Bacteroidales bacterium]
MFYNLFQNKWKLIILIIALIISGAFMWYTNQLVSKLAEEERQKIQIWAEANKELQETPLTGEVSLYMFKIISENKTIPRILVDGKGKIINSMNLNPEKEEDPVYLAQELHLMKAQNEPIEIELSDNQKNYIYYKDSIFLTDLYYYPFLQFFIILLFLSVVYFAISISKKAEQNQLWVGMSKETAHQLGTPISSLLAWVELLKAREGDSTLVNEVGKDVNRLEKITERFSRIGSAPLLKEANICTVLKNASEYLRVRTSSRVVYIQRFPEDENVIAPINIELFEWVIENLWKNALDAMNNIGEIVVSVKQNGHSVYVDITDTGKGIPKSKFKSVFKPGFTTKVRGWGLGLSLAKRIIENYHKGKIYIRYSEIGRGTNFRIVLNKSKNNQITNNK